MATAATPLATGVRVVPLGVGEAFVALHYTTCMALGAGDDWLLIDCPHPIRKMLHEGSLVAGCPLDLDRIQGVVLSHLHADHACGLEDFAYYSHFILGRKARVLAHPEVLARMWDGLLAAGMGEVQVDPAGARRPRSSQRGRLLLKPSSARRDPSPVTFGPVRRSNVAGRFTRSRRPPFASPPTAGRSASAPIRSLIPA